VGLGANYVGASCKILSIVDTGVSQDKLVNWAGNIQYGTANVYAAKSVRDLQDWVRRQAKFKVLGTRHCFNRIADSTDQFVSVATLPEEVIIDRGASTVTVTAGMRYGQFCPQLDEAGSALHNLASLPHISVAGAIATATHGSGEKNGNLATAVSALEMVTAQGDVVQLSRKDGEAFNGAVVGLGALGVVTRITLEVQPAFPMRQYVYLDLPFSALAEHFDEIERAAYSVSLFTDWRNRNIGEVWLKCRDDFEADDGFFGAKAAAVDVHPIPDVGAEHCTEQRGVLGPWYERLPHFRMGFTPSAGRELQSEYFVARRHAVEAIMAVERLREQVSPLLLISEIRAIAADELWMSPCYRRPSVAIHFTWKQDWEAVSKLLPLIERELEPFEVRPHWGKLLTMSPAMLKKSYERLPEFVELARKWDPKGKMRNEFLRENVFGE
jgi:xylitol oxidase